MEQSEPKYPCSTCTAQVKALQYTGVKVCLQASSSELRCMSERLSANIWSQSMGPCSMVKTAQ